MSAVASDVAFHRFAERACADENLELEIGLDVPITMPMFRRLIGTLERDTSSQPKETLQLDVLKDSTRLEYHGQNLIETVLRASSKVIGASIAPSRVLVKRREMAPVSNEDFGYTVRLKREMDGSKGLPARDVSLKDFRLKRRFSFDVGMCRIDCTIVQENTGRSRAAKGPERLPLRFEVEVEFVLPRAFEEHGDTTTPAMVVNEMTAIALRCLGVMMGTSRPPTRADHASVARVLHNASSEAASAHSGESSDETTNGSVCPRVRAVGPQPVTLAQEHIVPDTADKSSFLWSGRYTVTDKADGLRCLLVVCERKAYTLDSTNALRMVAARVPASAEDSVLDGELITSSKTGTPVNHFIAFDAYRTGGSNVSGLALLSENSFHRTRSTSMAHVVHALRRADTFDGFQVHAKKFTTITSTNKAIEDTLEQASVHEYATDGLIFTPLDAPVGGRFTGDAIKLDGVWPQVFKWKPPETNTIDFLLLPCIDATESGAVAVEGELGVRSKPYYVNASYIPRKWEQLDVSRYMQFGERAFPSKDAEPRRFDIDGAPHAAKLYVPLNSCGTPVCQDGSEVYDNFVVECCYANDGAGRNGKWIPLRVRADKTDRYASNGVAGAANDWATATSVWQSITFPVTRSMLTRQETVYGRAKILQNPYYATRAFDRTRSMLHAMANFHNTVVKASLFADAASACTAAGSPSLMELACGKGGDLPRWADHLFDPIIGVDSDMDNIVNASDGVYARLASYKQALRGRTVAFVCMDATTRMRPPLDEVRLAVADSPHGDVISALWDVSSRSMTNTALSPLRGLVAQGFDVVSCQFAIHYMFQTDLTLDRFIRNIEYLLRPGGVFIATCFDGDRLASKLQSSSDGQLKGLTNSNAVAWSISKRYDGLFEGNPGAAIDVYVDSIHHTVREYLVSTRTLQSRMHQVGIAMVSATPFSSWFAQSASSLSAMERKLSELYVAYVFKRTASTDKAGVPRAKTIAPAPVEDVE